MQFKKYIFWAILCALPLIQCSRSHSSKSAIVPGDDFLVTDVYLKSTVPAITSLNIALKNEHSNQLSFKIDYNAECYDDKGNSLYKDYNSLMITLTGYSTGEYEFISSALTENAKSCNVTMTSTNDIVGKHIPWTGAFTIHYNVTSGFAFSN